MPRPSRKRQAEEQGRAADRALLIVRLRHLGLPERCEVEVHTNRRVMVSLTPRGTLRVHRGYVYAPDRTLAAILTFVRPTADRRARGAAREVIVAFPVERYVPSTRRRTGRRVTASDREQIERLRAAHTALNEQWFDGALSPVPIRLSSRMTTRLGELAVEASGMVEIALNRHHVVADAWDEVRDTLLHEMVHQWQVENGYAVDHGARFRAKARSVGLVPRARKTLGKPRVD